MHTAAELISFWPSLAFFAAEAGSSYEVAKKMRLRNSIPVEYWPAIIKAAANRGIDGVTAESLMALSTRAAASANGEQQQ